ncbi:MAG: Ig-like domain-containing protein [Clostridiales bacterium]|nr:Ig-like domain-containing protein [Clostridiales bacterium]
MKSIKRFLSTILAMALICSCMVVMNISTAFADDTVTVYLDAANLVDSDYSSLSSGDTVKLSNAYYFTDGAETPTVYTDYSFQIGGGNGTYTVPSTAYTCTDDSSLTFGAKVYPTGAARTYSLYLPANSSVVFYVAVADSSDSGKASTFTLAYGGDDENITYSSTSSSITAASGSAAKAVTFSNIESAGIYTLSKSDTNNRFNFFAAKITYSSSPTVKVTATSSTIEPNGTTSVVASVSSIENEYTLSWSSSDEAVATVASDGTVTGVANGTATITATITVGEATYTGSTDITVDDGSAWVVRSAIGTVSLIESDFDGTEKTYDDGTVINKYFTVNGSTVKERASGSNYFTELPGKSASTIQFETAVSLTVTVNYASTNSTNVSLINIKDSEGNPVAIMGSKVGGGSSDTGAFTVVLPKGVYDIYTPAGRASRLYSVTFAEASTVTTADTVVETIGDSTYVFFGIPTKELTNASFYVNVDGTPVTDSTGDTVYTGVTISGATYAGGDDTATTDETTAMDENYSAAALGISTDYVVGYKIDSETIYDASYYTLSYNE